MDRITLKRVFIQTMQGMVSGDGDIKGRMNAGPDTVQPFSDEMLAQMQEKANEMRSRNLTLDQVEAELSVEPNFD